MAGLLVLEDAVIRSILGNAAIVREFPFMTAVAKQATAASGCVPCGAHKNRTNETDLSGVRAAIATMDQERKIRLKQMLGVDKIRVYFVNHQRQQVKLEF